MTPEQEKLRADAVWAARDYGYASDTPVPDSLRAPPGKFEGAPYYALHFYTEALDGGGDEPLYEGDQVAADVVEVSEDERVAFDLRSDTSFMAVWYSESGFVSLEELTAREYDELRERYDEEHADDSDEDSE